MESRNKSEPSLLHVRLPSNGQQSLGDAMKLVPSTMAAVVLQQAQELALTEAGVTNSLYTTCDCQMPCQPLYPG